MIILGIFGVVVACFLMALVQVGISIRTSQGGTSLDRDLLVRYTALEYAKRRKCGFAHARAIMEAAND